MFSFVNYHFTSLVRFCVLRFDKARYESVVFVTFKSSDIGRYMCIMQDANFSGSQILIFVTQ